MSSSRKSSRKRPNRDNDNGLPVAKMLIFLFSPISFVVALYQLVKYYPSALYYVYVFISGIIDLIFVIYLFLHKATEETPQGEDETKYASLDKQRWTIITWKYERSFYVFFTLYSFVSGVISFALICVYTINFCMERTLQVIDHHFDNTDKINKASFYWWCLSLITVWIYQQYQEHLYRQETKKKKKEQKNTDFFEIVETYGSAWLKWFTSIFCSYLIPLSWLWTLYYIITTPTEASKTFLRGAGLTIVSLYFVIFFSVFIALQSLSLLWYNYGDHKKTFFKISKFIKLPSEISIRFIKLRVEFDPASLDFEINPARFWRVCHVIVTIIFEFVEITVVDDVHFSRDYLEKFCKWMAIQGLVWAFIYFIAQLLIVIFTNIRLFGFNIKHGRNSIFEQIKLFVKKVIETTSPLDEALFLVGGVFILEHQIFWAIGTFCAYIIMKYMHWYDSAWALSNCCYWWFMGKRRPPHENFYTYWGILKAKHDSMLLKRQLSKEPTESDDDDDDEWDTAPDIFVEDFEFKNDTTASSNFNKRLIGLFFVGFVLAAVIVGIQITPYFKRSDQESVDRIVAINVDVRLGETSCKEMAKMNKQQYIDMITMYLQNKNHTELKDTLNKNMESNAFPYPVCSIIGAHNHLTILDLIMFTMIPYLETKEQHLKVLETWFGIDKYQHIHYNEESPAFFHIKYKPNDSNDYRYDVIAIRGTKKIHDFTQDLSLFTEVASLQVVSWLFPLTSFLPNPFLRKFIYFASWNWEKFISKTKGKKYTLFYHKIEQYMLDHMEQELSEDQKYTNSIYVVGHSLGGGLAEIVASKFAHNNYTNVFSFGLSSPGVSMSSQKFEFDSDTLDKTSISVIPKRDIVPKIDVHGGLKQQIDCAQSSFLDCHYAISSFCEIVNSCPKLIQNEKKKVFANCICIDNLGLEYNTFCYGGNPNQNESSKIKLKQEL